MGKRYQGYRRLGPDRGGRRRYEGRRVLVTGEDGRQRLLNPHRDMLNYFTKGYMWGELGPGTSQLAFALAFDVTRDRRRAQNVHEKLAWRVVSNLPFTAWRLTAEKLLAEIQAIEDMELVGELGYE